MTTLNCNCKLKHIFAIIVNISLKKYLAETNKQSRLFHFHFRTMSPYKSNRFLLWEMNEIRSQCCYLSDRLPNDIPVLVNPQRKKGILKKKLLLCFEFLDLKIIVFNELAPKRWFPRCKFPAARKHAHSIAVFEYLIKYLMKSLP